jgi:GH18 family chitinase
MGGKKCILYHCDWVNYAPRNFQVKDIPIQAVTDIAYAFFNIKDSGGGNYVITAGDV